MEFRHCLTLSGTLELSNRNSQRGAKNNRIIWDRNRHLLCNGEFNLRETANTKKQVGAYVRVSCLRRKHIVILSNLITMQYLLIANANLKS